jgi:hypothetical protein
MSAGGEIMNNDDRVEVLRRIRGVSDELKQIENAQGVVSISRQMLIVDVLVLFNFTRLKDFQAIFGRKVGKELCQIASGETN